MILNGLEQLGAFRPPIFALSLACSVLAAGPVLAEGETGSTALPEALEHTVIAPLWPAVQEFYAARDDAPLWLEDGVPTSRAKRAVAHLAAADQEGLDPVHYRADELAKRLANDGPHDLPLDLAITGELLHFLYELRHGRLRDAEPGAVAVSFDPQQALTLLTGTADIGVALQNAAPGNAPYRALRRALSTYTAIARSGEDAPIPAGPSIKPGMEDPRVPLIRARLDRLGDLVARTGDPGAMIHDPVLVQSVIQFQKRHGLEPDGVIGKMTLAEMNISTNARIDQIAVNMERWRWLPSDLGDDYILVNIAGFRLEVYELGVPSMEMAVVVGRPFRRTPVFSAEISYLEFSPTWTVPPTILKEDIIPGMRKDPELLAKKGVRIFNGWSRDAAVIDPTTIDWKAPASQLMGYRYVQPPGPKNALGGVKFMFPNKYSVYLHDTPDKNLFGKASRAFSSGCIRVQRPADLAALLLADQPKWTAPEIEKAMSLSSPLRVNLTDPLPIYITYATAWIGEGGTIEFRPDIYGRDATLQEQLLNNPK